MIYCYFESPVGKLLLTGRRGIEGLHFPVGTTRVEPQEDWVEDDKKFSDARSQLAEYFSGQRQQFELALNTEGTAFQKQVWDELLKIPYGQTITYGELAKRIGNPRASRAVGLANGKNPISIIIPCHRVIGADGSLTGFGGGIKVKQYLLELESRHSGESS